MDITMLDDAGQKSVLYFNGPPRFKCPKPRCQQFSAGFSDRKTRDTHVDKHTRPFKCPKEGYPARLTGFSTQVDCDRHLQRLHPDNITTQLLFPTSNRRKVNIFTACKENKFDVVRELIRGGVGVNQPQKVHGYITPLILAARHGNVLICQYLVQHGARVYPSNSTDYREKALPLGSLGEAILRQDYEVFRVLVEAAGKNEKSNFIRRSLFPTLKDYIRLALARDAAEILQDLLSWYRTPTDVLWDTILDDQWDWECNEATAHCLVSGEMSDSDRYRICRSHWKNGETLLHIAVQAKSVNIVRALLDSGASANVPDQYGRSPIRTSCADVDVKFDDCLGILLEYTDDPNHTNQDGETVLQAALRHDRMRAVEMLFPTDTDPDSQDQNGETITQAAQHGHTEVFRRLLKKLGHRITREHAWYIFLLAARNGHMNVVKNLLQYGVGLSVEDDGWAMLEWAGQNQHEDVVKFLLVSEMGLGLKEADLISLKGAIQDRKVDAVKMLLVKVMGRRTSTGNNRNVLLCAFQLGYADAATLLLESDVSNTAMAHAWRTLDWAVQHGRADVVEIMLDKGVGTSIDVNVVLAVAAQYGNTDVMKLALQRKIDPDHVLPKTERTPLFLAAMNGHTEAVKTLLSTGKVDVNFKDKWDGMTPLSWAAKGGHKSIVELLLNTNAVNITSVNKRRMTPQMYAEKNGHEEVTKLLRSFLSMI